MIRKFGRNGEIVEFESPRTAAPGADQLVEVPILLDTPERKYEGTWEPGKNHPTLPADETGPYAGIIRYLPIPEEQIQR